MLSALSIQSVALIDRVDLQLSDGLTVFTGETGAGKSILLDAIGLILGDRADLSLIRHHAQSATVEALFFLRQQHVESLQDLLQEWGISLEDSQLLISREIHRSGRTVCRMNGKMVTVQMLRSIADKLVERHGQHDSYALCRPEEQLRVLDAYGGHTEAVLAVKRAYVDYKRAVEARDQANVDEHERMRRLDTLRFQIDDIQQADLHALEEDELRLERKRLQHADRIRGYLVSALQPLTGYEATSAALDGLAESARQVEMALQYDEALSEVTQLLETAVVHTEEAIQALERRLGRIDDDPARLEEVDNRLATIRSLERKYGASVEAVLAHLQNCQEELDALNRHEETLGELEQKVRETDKALQKAADVLHDARVSTATRLASTIESVLHELNMPSARFVIDVQEEGDCGSTGRDSVSFLFSANRGEQVRPLAKVASGGELSRLLLGIKSALATEDDVACMIFDEIDTGVSGVAVERLADRLVDLSRDRQILCVTHSPQVAAAADLHYRIEKEEQANETVTRVDALDTAGREHEISRLIGGAVSDATALAHAAALLQKSRT